MFEKPAPRPRKGATDLEAIELCADWMRYLGATDTVVANPANSVPCDLYSSRNLGWVDNRSVNVPQSFVSDAVKVSTQDGRVGLIFFRYGFDPYAQQIATSHGIALISFTPESGDLHGLNQLGRNICAHGFG